MKLNFMKASLVTLGLTFLFGAANVYAVESTPLKKLWDDEAKSASLHGSNLNYISASTPGYTKYQNVRMGYVLSYPSTWSIDKHQVPTYTRFYNDNFRLDIFAEQLKSTTLADYIQNTTKNISSNITKNETFKTSTGLDVTVITYKRSLIPNLVGDQNNYTYYFVENNGTVYTFQLKTNDAQLDSMKAEVKSMITGTQFSTANDSNLNDNFTPSTMSPTIDYKAETRSLKIEPNQVVYGLYEPVTNNMADREAELGTHFGSQMFYKPIDTLYDVVVDRMVKEGKAPLVTFHFRSYYKDSDTTTVTKTINGDYDQYIRSWAQGVKNTKSPLFIRIGNEMNGQWTFWSHQYNYNDPDLYKLAYRHVVDIFREEGATNARFVWNPNDGSSPGYIWNQAPLYYPGDNYVDWLGMTAYNFGNLEWGGFKYFDDLYSELYKTYMRSFPNKPMMIGEFASVEANGNKAYFIKDMFEKVPAKYPNLKLVIWFNSQDREYILPYNSSEASFAAFKEGLKSPHILQYPVTENYPDGFKLNVENNSSTTLTNWHLTGEIINSDITALELNGISQNFQVNNNKFDQVFKLQKGTNTITIKVSFIDGTSKTFSFFINKTSSFTFTRDIGANPSSAPSTANSLYYLAGFVPDTDIKTLKINGVATPIQYSWRQFTTNIGLKGGMNEIVFTGYDADGNQIMKESHYIFRDSELKVSTLPSTNSTHTSLTKTITGIAGSPNVTSVKVNGITQTLKNSWRQFDQVVTLRNGINKITIDAFYKGTINGENFEYPIRREYIVEAPMFKLLSDAGFTPNEAGKFSTDKTFIGGIVSDPRINSLTINGEPVKFLYTWKQIKHDVVLKPGMNSFKVVGYSDTEHKNKVSENFLYLFNDSELKFVSPTDTFMSVPSKSIVFTGLASNTNIKSVAINGVNQVFKYYSRQFDQPVSLPLIGNNKVDVRFTYSGLIDGKSYTLYIQKPFTVHTPSFAYEKPVSYKIETAIQTSNSTEAIKGKVIDTQVKALKINGTTVPLNSLKQFQYNAVLISGLNAIKLSGYSDANYQNKLFDETIFYFNDKGLVISEPKLQNSTSTSKDVSISGYLAYDTFKSLKINGVSTNLQYAWRQFNTSLNFRNPGTYAINFEAVHQSTYEGKPYTYVVKKTYRVTIPQGTKSFQFTTPVGTTTSTAPAVAKNSTWIGFLTKDNAVKTVTVNGQKATLNYSWRQVSMGVTLPKLGINEIRVVGYSDDQYKNKVVEEVYYVNRTK